MTGPELAQARAAAGWNSAQLARACGLHPEQMRRLEASTAPVPEPLARWAAAAEMWARLYPVPRLRG